jgi:hypothetical protein
VLRTTISKLDTSKAPMLRKLIAKMENPPIPLNRELIKEDMDADGYVKGNVVVSMSRVNATEYDGEYFLDLLSELLTGSVGLMDMDFNIVDVLHGDKLVMEVSGDAREIFKGE